MTDELEKETARLLSFTDDNALWPPPVWRDHVRALQSKLSRLQVENGAMNAEIDRARKLEAEFNRLRQESTRQDADNYRLRQQLADLRPGPGNCLLNVERGTLCAVEGFCQLKQGEWIAAADVNRMAGELDVAINGEDGAAKAPSLCDVVAQAKKLFEQRGEPVGKVLHKPMAEIKVQLWDESLSDETLLYTAPPAQSAVPKGWKLVPVEPTAFMLTEARATAFGYEKNCAPSEFSRMDYLRVAYIAAINATPSAGEAQGDGREAWRSIDDSPEEGQWALVYWEGAYNCAFVKAGEPVQDWTNPANPNVPLHLVTHWMPLPEPPAAIAAQRGGG